MFFILKKLLILMVLVDDVGSFPLPAWINERDFTSAYKKAREDYGGEDFKIIAGVVLDSFEEKLKANLDVAAYPQHYSMHLQFLEQIKSNEEEPYLISEEKARIIEADIIREHAKEICENFNLEKIKLKVVATGAIELYLATELKNNIYKDIALNLAKSVNRFLKNSIFNEKYIETFAISIDEPSLGYADLLNVSEDDVVDILEESFSQLSCYTQLHLHSLTKAELALQAKNIKVIGAEFAANEKNFEMISRRELEAYDKFIRAGIVRTDIDSIIAGFASKGITPNQRMLIDGENEIRRRFEKASELFADRLLFAGPDCGLSSWISQSIARELLERVANVVHRKSNL